MTNSRAKGARAEVEFAHFLETYGIEAKRGQQHAGGTDSPDVKTNMGTVHFEVKRTERTDLYGWLDQAIKDSGNGEKVPVVAHRKNGKDWLAVLPMHGLLTLLAQTKHWPKDAL